MIVGFAEVSITYGFEVEGLKYLIDVLKLHSLIVIIYLLGVVVEELGLSELHFHLDLLFVLGLHSVLRAKLQAEILAHVFISLCVQLPDRYMILIEILIWCYTIAIWIEAVYAGFSFDVYKVLAVVFAAMVQMLEVQGAEQLVTHRISIISICTQAWELRSVRDRWI